MKPGQIFNLPENVTYRLGHIGRIRDKETEKRIIAKYEVVEVEGKLMGKVLVTYGNKRASRGGEDKCENASA